MRRSEVTPNLIELSKKAKELGFPQDVEKGDWIHYHVGRKEQIVLVDESILDELKYANIWLKEYTLILSFSRCLEWLSKNGWQLRHLVEYPETTSLRFDVFISNYKKGKGFLGEWEIFEKTHHEAIAKAVVKILGDNDE